MSSVQPMGSFLLERELGRGSMGIVYQGRHRDTGRPAAIKVLLTEQTRNSKAHQRFQREAKILEGFRHPNIVRYLAYGRSSGKYYFAMEFVDGQTFEDLIEASGSLPWLEVVQLAIQLCEALHYSHQHGVIHRDLKPSNLMITSKGQVKLADFGIAKIQDATALTQPGRTLGTGAYMAPEQIRDESISHRTDLYALGCVLYQMLTNKLPFQGQTMVQMVHAHLTETPPWVSETTNVPEDLDWLIAELLVKSPHPDPNASLSYSAHHTRRDRAQPPTERPFDAAIVAQRLKELRDRAVRGGPITMVWPDSSVNPTRPGFAQQDQAKKTKKSKKTGSRKSKSGRSSTTTRAVSLEGQRQWISVAGLVLALGATIGFIIYQLIPPSMEELFDDIRALNASDSSGDWGESLALMERVERDHPGHPYQQEFEQWRDRLMVHQAKKRGNLLLNLRISPRNSAERLYVAKADRIAEAKTDGDLLEERQLYRELAEQLDSNDPEERRWELLALEELSRVESEIAQRRELVAEEVREVVGLIDNGRFDEAKQLGTRILEKYQADRSVEDPLRQLQERLATLEDSQDAEVEDEDGSEGDSTDSNRASEAG